LDVLQTTPGLAPAEKPGLSRWAVRHVAEAAIRSILLLTLILAKHVKGKKTDQGYRHFPEANMSVQGQDAPNAWKTTANILKAMGYAAEVTFAWYDNPKAANPGQVGKFVIQATE
jgi:hypothetical protein